MKSAFVLAVVFFLTFASCKKEEECTAVITIRDTLGNTLQGATVRLFAGDVNRVETSDAVGQATFIFKSPAILDIEASHPDYSYSITGIITLEEGKKIKQTLQF